MTREKKLEEPKGEIQATKHDQGKPNNILVPARAWDRIETHWDRIGLKDTNVGRLFMEVKVGKDDSIVPLACAVINQARNCFYREDPLWWLKVKEDMIRVFEFGAKKYDVGNWHAGKGFKWSRLINAAEHHWDAWHWGNEMLDPESGLKHAGHLMCCITMLLEHVIMGHGEDDRFPAQFQPKS